MALDVTFSRTSSEDDSTDSAAYMHAPSTPMLNHFAAHLPRNEAYASPAKYAHQESGELSPIQSDCLPSEAAVVDLYTQITTGAKPAYDTVTKPVRSLSFYP